MASFDIKKICIFLLTTCISLIPVTSDAEQEKSIKVVLVGDSTTIGNTPRQIKPDGLHLEQMIMQLAKIEGLPTLEVINTGKGGESAKRLLESGYYNKAIAPIKDVDYIFVRLGINDWFRCKNLAVEFPNQLKAVIARLRKDHPEAVIIPSTICRFGAHEKCVDINNLIKQVAKDERLSLFDAYSPYNKYLQANGENSLNVRQCPLSKIPEKYHAWLKPYTHLKKGRKGKPGELVVRVNDMSLDPLFGHIKGWYFDRHPNSTGYNLIAAETVKYLSTIIGK